MKNSVKTPTKRESRVIKFMILLGLFSLVNFLFFFFQPAHRVNSVLFGMLAVVIFYGALKKLYMWYNYSNISVPETPEKDPGLSVDVMTTYFPGEPHQMIMTTLKAIKNIRHPHETYLCDEADDPVLRSFCLENGIHHVTRDNRKDAKAGNINHALSTVASGDICAILDPDHIPQPNFLDPILPHFSDPKIGFVQMVQSYYNIDESLVAKGAAEQTFQFYGPMMMTLNSYGAVNAIGANCVFRRSALDSIGGHAPGLCEDMHTAMLLYAKGWKAVYVPQVLAKGLAPATLTNFFKQQLKWARGTFDLWINVYPKIFQQLTVRQKIHYGILPMHYLSGVIILFTFLIPILSLFFSTTPWRGNIVDFGLVFAPVAASAILIRTFIQKWVIEKKERGFHIIGGLLHINTWWIYITGLVYTLMNKKVPYLPTPKEGVLKTHLNIVLPNAVVAIVSIGSVFYGLYQDLTPFSIIMACFALFNAAIMMFGIYITVHVMNQNKILRNLLRKHFVQYMGTARKNLSRLSNSAFTFTRAIALPLLVVILISAMSFKHENDTSRWEDVYPPTAIARAGNYLGIFHPAEEPGLSDIREIQQLEREYNVNFEIISMYLAWNDSSLSAFPEKRIEAIYQMGALPMITWEPWASTLSRNDTIKDLQAEKNVFKHVVRGSFDPYIREFARRLKAIDRPVFLRPAHEFDNPQYPWSGAGGNTPETFKAAWKHIFRILKEEDAHKVMLVWNPWEADAIESYYPGDRYVDWVGLTMLDYGPLPDIRSYPFDSLYLPYKKKLQGLTRKPVMLAEFGSLKKGAKQEKWIQDALQSIKKNHEEISAVILFHSAIDKNLPESSTSKEQLLDWQVSNWEPLTGTTNEEMQSLPTMEKVRDSTVRPVTARDIRGVRYKKAVNWEKNYYVPSKEVLIEDFKVIKKAGMNTIHISGGNIYDHNLLRYSEKSGLDVIYEFRTFKALRAMDEPENLQELEEEILDRAEDLANRENVIAFAFDLGLEDQYLKPLLFQKEASLLSWLQDLISEIKAVAPNKSLVINLPMDERTTSRMQRISKILPVDSFGLIVEETKDLSKVLEESRKSGHSVFISSIDPAIFVQHQKELAQADMILENWQDERQSNWMNFEGLVDFRGRPKQILRKVSEVWTDLEGNLQTPPIRILKPAEPLYPGDEYEYHAAVFDGNTWHIGTAIPEDLDFEWNLIKEDPYGNALAVKKLETGPSAELTVPEQYKHYTLMLTVIPQDSPYIRSTRTSLHTPANESAD